MAMGGAMDKCGRFMKSTLIIVNLITFIVGLIVFGIGIWIWVSHSYTSTLMTNNMYIGSVGLIVVVGAATMIISLLGCCGATKEVKCMLLMYYILVFIIFVVLIVGGILLFVFREKVPNSLEREMYAAIPSYGVKHDYTAAWDNTQTYLQCCGVKSYKDWNGNVPESCCREIYRGKRQDCKSSQNPSTMYMDGCLNRASKLLRENSVYVGSAALVLALVMVCMRMVVRSKVVGMMFACGLFAKIK